MWSLIWKRRRHCRAAAVQARHSSWTCFASSDDKKLLVVVTAATQARCLLLVCLTLKTRGGATGATGATSQGNNKVTLSLLRWQQRRCRPGVCCPPAWCRGQEGAEQGQHRGRQQGQLWSLSRTRLTCATCAHSDPGRACDGAMVLATDAQGHLE